MPCAPHPSYGMERWQHRFGEGIVPWGHLAPYQTSDRLTWVPVCPSLKLSVVGASDKRYSIHCSCNRGTCQITTPMGH